MPLESNDKERAINFLRQNQTPEIESLIAGLTEGKMTLAKAITEIQEETAYGSRLMEIVLRAENS